MKLLIVLLFALSTVWAKPYIDMLGRSVAIPKAQTMVFLGPGALRLGVYLGLQERVIGLEQAELSPVSMPPYREYFRMQKTQKLPIVGVGGPGKMPNLEALIVNKPDVIFTSFLSADQIAVIAQKTGIPVVALSYGVSYGGSSSDNLGDIKRSLELIGKITGVSARAEQVVSFIKSEEEALASIKLPKKSLYIGGISYKGVQPLTSTDANYPPFELLGVKNAVLEGKTLKGHQFIDFEALLKTDPDLIFTDGQSKDRIAQDYAEHTKRYTALQAYAKGNVKEVLGFNNYGTNVENLLLISWQIAAYLGHDGALNQKALTVYDAFYPKSGKALLSKLSYRFEQ